MNPIADFIAAHNAVAANIAERARLAAWLVEHDGMSTRQVAELVGVTHQTIRNWIASTQGGA